MILINTTRIYKVKRHLQYAMKDGCVIAEYSGGYLLAASVGGHTVGVVIIVNKHRIVGSRCITEDDSRLETCGIINVCEVCSRTKCRCHGKYDKYIYHSMSDVNIYHNSLQIAENCNSMPYIMMANKVLYYGGILYSF